MLMIAMYIHACALVVIVVHNSSRSRDHIQLYTSVCALHVDACVLASFVLCTCVCALSVCCACGCLVEGVCLYSLAVGFHFNFLV